MKYFLQENGQMTFVMAMVSTHMPMEIHTMESGVTICGMVRVHTPMPRLK